MFPISGNDRLGKHPHVVEGLGLPNSGDLVLDLGWESFVELMMESHSDHILPVVS